jgi:hypothetical protein
MISEVISLSPTGFVMGEKHLLLQTVWYANVFVYCAGMAAGNVPCHEQRMRGNCVINLTKPGKQSL